MDSFFIQNLFQKRKAIAAIAVAIVKDSPHQALS